LACGNQQAVDTGGIITCSSQDLTSQTMSE
jgi:hypothetical protein